MAEPTLWPTTPPEGAPRAVDLIADILHDAFKGATDVDLDMLAADAVDALTGPALAVELRWYDGEGGVDEEGVFVLGRTGHDQSPPEDGPTRKDGRAGGSTEPAALLGSPGGDASGTTGGLVPFDPDWVVAPGEMLAEWARDSELTAHQAAQRVDLHIENYMALLVGELALTNDVAGRLAVGTGISARMWLNMERIFRAGLAAGKRHAIPICPDCGMQHDRAEHRRLEESGAFDAGDQDEGAT
jgi:plasmid maintenance system antidote protein VapI